MGRLVRAGPDSYPLDVTVRTDTNGVTPTTNNLKLLKGEKMKNRKRIPKKKSKKLFSKTAKATHKKNISPGVMRGGIRL